MDTEQKKNIYVDIRCSLRIPGLSEQSLLAARTRNSRPLRLLLDRADELCLQDGQSVTDKVFVPPSGDKRDFVSLSLYFWPDPGKPDGKPYIAKDGYRNPEGDEYDHIPMKRMVGGVDHLVLAWEVTRERKYAESACRWLRRWFIDPETAMNPNMNWAQFIPGKDMFGKLGPGDYPIRYIQDPVTGEGLFTSFGGTIEASCLIIVPELINLLNHGGFLTVKEFMALRQWFSKFLTWLKDSVPGNDARMCRNNHAAWFCAYAGYAAVLAGNNESIAEILGGFLPSCLKKQIRKDGAQPEELQRPASFGYTMFSLTAFCDATLLVRQYAPDLFSSNTAQNALLRQGIDFVLPYCLGEAEWGYPDLHGAKRNGAVPVFAAAYYLWEDERYRKAIRNCMGVEPEKDNCGQGNDYLYRLLYSV